MSDHPSQPSLGRAARWRLADERDDEAVVELCLGLYREDPGTLPWEAPRLRETLVALRREPWRGRAVVVDMGGLIVGYALLVAFWSNHLGGEVCEVDELYVRREFRGRGHGSALFEEIERGGDLWPAPPVAIALGITPSNTRARHLYERQGFLAAGVSMVKSLRPT
jgi:ribosomal protein S18 acetylase RimI-like enzyme